MIFLSEVVRGERRLRAVEQPRFDAHADVLVCGLGTAGSLAALYCAREGLRVVGVEPLTCMGGTHTAGGVGHHYFGCAGGRYLELDRQVEDFAARYTCTQPEARKLLLEQALWEQGAQIRYGATVCGVYLEDKTVIGLRVLTQTGLQDIGAKVVLDCTAEAQVAYLAGCATQKGRSSDGQMQPYSLVCMVYNGTRYHYTNRDFGRVDQTDPEDLSRAVLFCRSYRVAEIDRRLEHIQQLPLLGVREGRRILAQEMVLLEDVLAGKKTETPIYYAYADLDKHGWDIAFDGQTLGDWAIGANLGAYNVTVPIPRDAILPRDFEGLLVPCRGLGVDRDVSSCVRMIPDMKKLAEAAACWACLAIRRGTPLRQVPYDRLRQRLEASGCLKASDDRGCRVDGKKNWDGSPLTPRTVHWLTEPEALEQPLSTLCPGVAIWSAMRMGSRALPTLAALLESKDENTARHAAFAMAGLGDRRCLPVLRNMLARRDALILEDNRKNNNPRGCIAIYWLGRLADRESAQALLELVRSEEEGKKAVYRETGQLTTRYAVADFRGLYFQFMSQAVMALVRIGDAHPDLRAQIGEGFASAFATEDYYHRLTGRPRQTSEGNMVLAIGNVALSAAKNWKNME